MSRPFDEARYAGLLEGLEATEIPYSVVATGTETKRFDPEYFNRAALLAQRRLQNAPRLGDLVRDGYRVVYETTQAIDREVGIKAGLPFFLQAADISTPFIDADSMICVSEEDWRRYPKGRIQPGELLIEVKGKAEKIAIVPDDFPTKTLVTGTCFKLTTKDPDDRFLLIAYLTCKYGQALKERLKTNLLVSYLARDDLYSLPVPKISGELRTAIKVIFEQCFLENSRAKRLQLDAEKIVLSTLNLQSWQPPEPLTYTVRASDVFAVSRFDAEYFSPAKRLVIQALSVGRHRPLGDHVDSVREMFVPGTPSAFGKARNYDLTNALRPVLDDSIEPVPIEEIGSTKKRFQNGDVVISRLRSYLKEIAIVKVNDDIPAMGSSEFIVLRPREAGKYTISPELLWTYLNSGPVQTILKWCIDGSQHPRFSEGDLLSIPLPEAIYACADEINALIDSAHSARARAKLLLEVAKRAVELVIEKDEERALAYLLTTLEP